MPVQFPSRMVEIACRRIVACCTANKLEPSYKCRRRGGPCQRPKLRIQIMLQAVLGDKPEELFVIPARQSSSQVIDEFVLDQRLDGDAITRLPNLYETVTHMVEFGVFG